MEAGGLVRLQQRLRELKYHPERFLPPDGASDHADDFAPLAVQKQRWVETSKTHANAAERRTGPPTADHRHLIHGDLDLILDISIAVSRTVVRRVRPKPRSTELRAARPCLRVVDRCPIDTGVLTVADRE